MDDATGRVPTPGYRVVQGVHCKTSLHSVADGVADDAAGEHVFDGAEVELALVGPVVGDDGQPHFVVVIGGEVALDVDVVERRAGARSVLGVVLSEYGPPLVVLAIPP